MNFRPLHKQLHKHDHSNEMETEGNDAAKNISTKMTNMTLSQIYMNLKQQWNNMEKSNRSKDTCKCM